MATSTTSTPTTVRITRDTAVTRVRPVSVFAGVGVFFLAVELWTFAT